MVRRSEDVSSRATDVNTMRKIRGQVPIMCVGFVSMLEAVALKPAALHSNLEFPWIGRSEPWNRPNKVILRNIRYGDKIMAVQFGIESSLILGTKN